MPSTYEYSRRTLRSDLWIAGKQLNTGVAEIAYNEQRGSSSLLRMLAGNTVYQRRAGERFAPMVLAPWQEIELQLLAIGEDDRDFLSEIAGQNVPAFFEIAQTDVYFITSELHTDWVLSRALPWLRGPASDYPVTVRVVDVDDRSNYDALTIAGSSPPGAGEYFYTGVAGEDSIETADLTAEAGRLLTVTYSPIRRIVVEEVDSTVAGADRNGALDVTVRMAEHLPTKAW